MDSIEDIYARLAEQPSRVRDRAVQVVKYLKDVVQDGWVSLPDENYEEDLYPVQILFEMARFRFMFQVNPEGGLEIWREGHNTAYLGDSLDDFTLSLFFEEDY
jgi:hypothetical protein